MKLTKDTLQLLKNFASINSNLIFEKGNTIYTNSPHMTLIASAQVEETFDVPSDGFGIYNLNEFLTTLTLFNEPELEFQDKSVIVKEGKTSIKYLPVEDVSILSIKTKDKRKDIKVPPANVEFSISQAEVVAFNKAASILGTTDVSFVGDGKNIKIVVHNKKNLSSNKYEHVVGETSDRFSFNVLLDNLKMLPLDYDVALCNGMGKFEAVDRKLSYIFAIEKDSTFAR